jgi:hypothetical protein
VKQEVADPTPLNRTHPTPIVESGTTISRNFANGFPRCTFASLVALVLIVDLCEPLPRNDRTGESDATLPG